MSILNVAEGHPLPALAPGDEPPMRDPRPRRLGESIREVVASRHLLSQMVRRDLTTKHAGSVLGFLWSLLTPALTVVVYGTVFYLFDFRPTKGAFRDIPFALFFFAGLVLWSIFNAGLAGGAGSVVDSGFLVRKIYFPRELLPLSVVLAGLVTFAFELAVLVAFAVILGHPPTWTFVLALPIVAIVAVMAYGCGLFLAAATVYFRDVQHFIAVLLQLLFWASPIIYDLSFIQDRHPAAASLLLLNPVTPCIIAFREAVLIGEVPGLWRLLYSAVAAVAAVVLGSIYFNRQERRMAEIV